MRIGHFKCIFSLITTVVFSIHGFSLPHANAQTALLLPQPGVRVNLSPALTPAHLKGLVINPNDALNFEFLIHQGDKPLQGDARDQEYQRLIKYFLASLTIPDDDQWVNLSPYEKNRIIEPNFSKTEMGRDLLAQDYLLKQIASSMVYPEDDLGKKFWQRVFDRSKKELGTTEIPMATMNKIWIVPDFASIYEKDNTVYVVENRLKVMMEDDYLALAKNSLKQHMPIKGQAVSPAQDISSQVMRDIIIPELTKEVNEGKNFAQLRQIYSGMLLATWYKRALKESLLGKVYANKAKVAGVNIDDPKENEKIYQQYLQAFKKGVFNYIKEDVDQLTKEPIPRKYFSGGMRGFNQAMITRVGLQDAQRVFGSDQNQIVAVNATMASSQDAAMAQRFQPPKFVVNSPELLAMIIARSVKGFGYRADNIDKVNFNRQLVMINANPLISFEGVNIWGKEFRRYLKISVSPLRITFNPDKNEQRYRNEYKQYLKTLAKAIVTRFGNQLFSMTNRGSIDNVDKSLRQLYLRDNILPQLNLGVLEFILEDVAGELDLESNGRQGPNEKWRIVLANQAMITMDQIGEIVGSVNLGEDPEKAAVRRLNNLLDFIKGLDGNNLRDKLRIFINQAEQGGITFKLAKELEMETGVKDYLQLGSRKVINIRMGKVVDAEEYMNGYLYLMVSNRVTAYDLLLYIPGGPENLIDDKAMVELTNPNQRELQMLISQFIAKISKDGVDSVRIKNIEDSLNTQLKDLLLEVERTTISYKVAHAKLSAEIARYEANIQLNGREVTGNPIVDPALVAQDRLGGIDLNAANLDLRIKRDGRGVPLPLNQQNLDDLNAIEGFVPVIINIRPVMDLPILTELRSHTTTSALPSSAKRM